MGNWIIGCKYFLTKNGFRRAMSNYRGPFTILMVLSTNFFSTHIFYCIIFWDNTFKDCSRIKTVTFSFRRFLYYRLWIIPNLNKTLIFTFCFFSIFLLLTFWNIFFFFFFRWRWKERFQREYNWRNVSRRCHERSPEYRAKVVTKRGQISITGVPR